jgi:hypothetical protein
MGKSAFALPFTGYSLLQLVKFRKLSITHELLFTLLISFPYLVIANKPEKVNACTQTDMEMEEMVRFNTFRKADKGFGFKVAGGLLFVAMVMGIFV